MKIKDLNPNEVLTTLDFPVHNGQILKIYFKVCRDGDAKILPPTPMIPLKAGLPLLEKDKKGYNKRMKEFLKKNKKIKYLLVDGSHKTTALTLTHNKIHSMILETNDDVKEVRELEKVGEVFNMNTPDTIGDILLDMAAHFSKGKKFESVLEKTKRMICKKVIPDFMIKCYLRKDEF